MVGILSVELLCCFYYISIQEGVSYKNQALYCQIKRAYMQGMIMIHS